MAKKFSSRIESLKQASHAAPASMPLKKRETKRDADRRKIFRYGTIVLDGKHQHRCIVKDLSPRGAKISAVGAGQLPRTLELKIDGMSGGEQAEVVWQDGDEAGLHFFNAG